VRPGNGIVTPDNVVEVGWQPGWSGRPIEVRLLLDFDHWSRAIENFEFVEQRFIIVHLGIVR
jgi:hypothetical protein